MAFVRWGVTWIKNQHSTSNQPFWYANSFFSETRPNTKPKKRLY